MKLQCGSQGRRLNSYAKPNIHVLGLVSPFFGRKEDRLWVNSLPMLQKQLKKNKPQWTFSWTPLIIFRISCITCFSKAWQAAQREKEFCILWKYPCGEERRGNEGTGRRQHMWVSLNGQGYWAEAKDLTQHYIRREHKKGTQTTAGQLQ